LARSSTTSRAAGTRRSMLSSRPWTIAAPPRGSTWRARCTSAPQHEGYARTARPAAHRRNGGRTSRANTTGSVVWIAGLLGPWPGCTEGVAHPTLSTRPSAAPALLRDAAGRPPPGPRKWSWAVVGVEPSRRVALLPVARRALGAATSGVTRPSGVPGRGPGRAGGRHRGAGHGGRLGSDVAADVVAPCVHGRSLCGRHLDRAGEGRGRCWCWHPPQCWTASQTCW
jgi:hypothetical protein